MSNPAILQTITVSLSVPVTVPGADGKNAERSQLTFRRPKVRHTKRLAVLIGSDIVDILMSSEGDAAKVASSTEGRKLVTDVLRKLLSEDRLDGLTALIADLAGEDPATIDDVDLLDLQAIAEAFAGFFPALQSALSGKSPATSQSSDATTPAP